MCARRGEKSVTHRASRCHRHHPAPRGVSGGHAALRIPCVAGDRPHGGRGGGGGVVPSHLSDRAEDGARMAEMKSSVVRRQWSVAPVIVAGVVALVGPLAGQTSLSIYSDGRVVVRRSLPQALEKGRNALTLKLEDLDPATLFSPDTSVALLSATARTATERNAA